EGLGAVLGVRHLRLDPKAFARGHRAEVVDDLEAWLRTVTIDRGEVDEEVELGLDVRTQGREHLVDMRRGDDQGLVPVESVRGDDLVAEEGESTIEHALGHQRRTLSLALAPEA